MKVFTNFFAKMKFLKISTKLLLLSSVVFIGFAAVGVMDYMLINSEKRIQQQIKDSALLEEHIAQADEEVLKAETASTLFLLDKKLKHIEDFERSIANSRTLLKNLEKEEEGLHLQQLFQQTKQAERGIDALHTSVRTLQENVLVMGLDENTGLQGEMRDAVHELEQELNKSIKRKSKESAQGSRTSTAPLRSQLLDTQLQTSMLTMRRHEKDFIQREDPKYISRMANEATRFLKLLDQRKSASSADAKLRGLLTVYQARFGDLSKLTTQLHESRLHASEATDAINPLLDTLTATARKNLDATLHDTDRQSKRLKTLFFLVLGGSIALVASISVILNRSITIPMSHLQETVLQVTGGDMAARARLERSDEIGVLANAFDTLLDERLAQMAEAERERETRLAEAERENTELNDSIVDLLQTVAVLSQRDLTVRAPVAENVTGAVSDALNALAEETSSVLTQVTRISGQVAAASGKVKTQSDAVLSLANQERDQVVQTSEELAAAAEAMNDIASHASECTSAAEAAIQKTQTALETVTGTVEGINATRDIIRETEKRIKRLGERSQEISGVVSLINNIAERTHILALNASMHAASAGEAGRGFAVVADEVQRLAENARQATEQIATLVTNIQTETMDTVTTMNTAITQVVEGSRLAGQAGEQMQETQQTTTELVEAVQQIIDSLQIQANISNELRNRASLIVESTNQTGQELAAQDEQTTQLLNFASRLVDTVNVFTLPDMGEELADESGEAAQPAEGSSNDTEQAQEMAGV